MVTWNITSNDMEVLVAHDVFTSFSEDKVNEEDKEDEDEEEDEEDEEDTEEEEGDEADFVGFSPDKQLVLFSVDKKRISVEKSASIGILRSILESFITWL